jgi:hypothetical protein
MVQRVGLIVMMILVSVTSVAAKDWRGIFPLHSTRDDVEKLFGRPQPKKDRLVVNQGRWIYFLEQEEVHFVFAEGKLPVKGDCVVPIADGTILMIYVRPKTQPLMTSLQIDATKFRKFDPSPVPDPEYLSFINEEDGLLIHTLKGKVLEIIYAATASDRPLCPGFYGNLERFVTPIVCGLNFDSYGNLRFSDEASRLDNFAIQLTAEDANGYIVVYAGRKGMVNEAQQRADRAKTYLVRVRGLESERLYAVDGGYSEDFIVRLYVAPPGAEPPPLTPTVDARKVEILSGKQRRSRRKAH